MFSWSQGLEDNPEKSSAIEQERGERFLLSAYMSLYSTNIENLPVVGFLQSNCMRSYTLYVGPPHNMSPGRPARKLAQLLSGYVRKKRKGRAVLVRSFLQEQAKQAEAALSVGNVGNVWSMDTGDSKYYRGVLKPSATIVRPKATTIRGAGRAAQQTKWYLMRGFRDTLSFYKPQEVAAWFIPKEELQEERQPLRVESTKFLTKRVTVAAMSETSIEVPAGSRGVSVQAEGPIEADSWQFFTTRGETVFVNLMPVVLGVQGLELEEGITRILYQSGSSESNVIALTFTINQENPLDTGVRYQPLDNITRGMMGTNWPDMMPERWQGPETIVGMAERYRERRSSRGLMGLLGANPMQELERLAKDYAAKNASYFNRPPTPTSDPEDPYEF